MYKYVDIFKADDLNPIIMPKAKVKGDLFICTMEYIKKKWGRKGLEAVDARPEDYPMEKWYPFEDYCDLLGRIGRELGQDNGKLVAHMGEEMMSHDVRWRTIFKGKKPEDIFTSTKRQDAQYAVGHMNVVDTENHNVILKEKL